MSEAERFDGIQLADGTQFKGSAGYMNGVLSCMIEGSDLLTLANTFSDKDKTAEIVFYYYDNKDVFRRFNNIMAIIIYDDYISVRLTGKNTYVKQGIAR